MCKIPNKIGFGHLGLVLGIYLEFGFWKSGFRQKTLELLFSKF